MSVFRCFQKRAKPPTEMVLMEEPEFGAPSRLTAPCKSNRPNRIGRPIEELPYDGGIKVTDYAKKETLRKEILKKETSQNKQKQHMSRLKKLANRYLSDIPPGHRQNLFLQKNASLTTPTGAPVLRQLQEEEMKFNYSCSDQQERMELRTLPTTCSMMDLLDGLCGHNTGSGIAASLVAEEDTKMATVPTTGAAARRNLSIPREISFSKNDDQRRWEAIGSHDINADGGIDSGSMLSFLTGKKSKKEVIGHVNIYVAQQQTSPSGNVSVDQSMLTIPTALYAA